MVEATGSVLLTSLVLSLGLSNAAVDKERIAPFVQEVDHVMLRFFLTVIGDYFEIIVHLKGSVLVLLLCSVLIQIFAPQSSMVVDDMMVIVIAPTASSKPVCEQFTPLGLTHRDDHAGALVLVDTLVDPSIFH